MHSANKLGFVIINKIWFKVNPFDCTSALLKEKLFKINLFR